MKKIVLYVMIPFIIIVFFAFNADYMHFSDLKNAATLLGAFKNSEARVVSSECYVWGLLDKEYCLKKGLNPVTELIAKRLGLVIDEGYRQTEDKNDYLERVTVSGFLEDGRRAAIGVQLDTKSDEGPQYTVTVSITQDASGSLLEASGKIITKALKDLSVTTRRTFSITGNFEGELEKSRLENICSKVFASAGARRVYGMQEKDLISISAYSPSIEDFIDFEGQKTNLNLALRYNSYEGKTYIWLATPVIITEY